MVKDGNGYSIGAQSSMPSLSSFFSSASKRQCTIVAPTLRIFLHKKNSSNLATRKKHLQSLPFLPRHERTARRHIFKNSIFSPSFPRNQMNFSLTSTDLSSFFDSLSFSGVDFNTDPISCGLTFLMPPPLSF